MTTVDEWRVGAAPPFANVLHEALAHEGLVPESERVHLIGCSLDYRTRFREALARAYDADPEDLKEQLESLQQDHDYEERRANRLERELSDEQDVVYELRQDVKRLEAELKRVDQLLNATKEQEATP